jgi:hypothetical protein
MSLELQNGKNGGVGIEVGLQFAVNVAAVFFGQRLALAGVVVALVGIAFVARGDLEQRQQKYFRAACGCIVRKTRNSLCRQSNRSLSARQISAGKMFSEARDRAEIFGEDCLFRTTETGISRVSLTKATESQRLFRRRQETGFAQDCVVADALHRDQSPNPNSLITGKLTGNF